MKKIFLTIFFMQSLVYAEDIKVVSKLDIEILKLNLIYYYHAHCQGNDDPLRIPLCISLESFLEQVELLLQQGEMKTSALVIPVIDRLIEKLDGMREQVKSFKEKIHISNEYDTELQQWVDVLAKDIEKTGKKDWNEIYQKLQQIRGKYEHQ